MIFLYASKDSKQSKIGGGIPYGWQTSIKNEVTSDTASFHSGAKSNSDLPEQLQQQLRDGILAAQHQ